MNKAAYDRLPADLKAVIDNNSGQEAAGMAGAMWDVEAKVVAEWSASAAIQSPCCAEDVAHWRAATGPVVAAG